VHRDFIGLRIARWRDLDGMTQQQLADAVGVTREYISMIENGKRPITKRSLLIALADALGVSIADLTGQPYEPHSQQELLIFSLASGVRTALDEDHDDTIPADPSTLATTARRVSVARMACDYPTLAKLLPGLVADTRRLAMTGDDHAVRQGLGLFVSAATDAAFAIKSHGQIDLAIRLAEAAWAAASELDQRAEKGAAAFAMAQCALTAGARRKSFRLAHEAAVQLDDADDDRTLTWRGLLHLHAALSAAALGRTSELAPHLAEAEASASRVVTDPLLQELTPANVGVWRVAIALENGEPDRAPEYARRVDRTQIRGVHRRASLHIDTGRGLYAAGRADEAVREFLRADELAPQKVRTRPWVLELVGQMVRDARRGGSSELRELAARCRIDPLAGPA
jgi:transcriptional regulator with XRE-family HTH domain/tetratricopeptide (TPR) repeat protein